MPGVEDTIENNGINLNSKMRPKRQKNNTAGHSGKTRRSMGTWPFSYLSLPPTSFTMTMNVRNRRGKRRQHMKTALYMRKDEEDFFMFWGAR